MVVIGILAALASIGYGPIMEHMKDGDRQKASTNVKSIFTLLQQFRMDHNSYPCDSTAESLLENNTDCNFGDLTGSNSNAYFRQLFYLSGVESEKPFFAKVEAGGLKVDNEPDNRIANGMALRPGENAMSYVMSRDASDPSVKSAVKKTSAPLVMCSVYPSRNPYTGDKLTVDLSSFGTHFYVLTGDGSVSDRGKEVQPTAENEDIGTLKKDSTIFPETKRGRSTAQDYYVLTPEV